MRALTFVAAAVLLLPPVADGQGTRTRRPPIARPPARAPLPPQAPGITDVRRYHALRFSIESYPLYSFVHTDRYVTDSLASNWSMQGVGSRLDWRVKPAFSMTGDLTTTIGGGLFAMRTVEIGGRLRPERVGSKSRPFVDLRTSWAYTYDTYAQSFAPNAIAGPPPTRYAGRTTSRGFGGLVGAGIETSVSRSFALTSGISLSRHYMSSVRVGTTQLGSDFNYQTTAVRFTVGVKYNPHRVVRPNP